MGAPRARRGPDLVSHRKRQGGRNGPDTALIDEIRSLSAVEMKSTLGRGSTFSVYLPAGT
jgi:hypothetical protein